MPNRSAEWLRGAVRIAERFAPADAWHRLRAELAEAEACEAGPNKGHKWELKPSVLPYPVCRVCGVVQRKDDQNSPCKGPVSISTREAQQASKEKKALSRIHEIASRQLLEPAGMGDAVAMAKICTEVESVRLTSEASVPTAEEVG